jgi:hypothetical protein
MYVFGLVVGLFFGKCSEINREMIDLHGKKLLCLKLSVFSGEMWKKKH